MSERLHKLLAQHGLGSRREIEKWMLAGRIRLNGRPAEPGDRYSAGDRVIVDGQDVTSRLRVTSTVQVIAYHKPQGQPVKPSTQDTDESAQEESVIERLPAVRGSRWLVVNTMQPGDSGLLLLTTDGKLADALRRRAESIPTAYVARVLVPAPEFDVTSMPRAVQYDDETIEFENVEPAGGEGINRWFRVESHRAHRRAAVRALFESNGLKVSRVIQVKLAGIELPRDLPRGKHRALNEREIAELYRLAGLSMPAPPQPRAAKSRSGKPLPKDRSAPNRRVPPDRRVSKKKAGKGPSSPRSGR